MTTPLDDFDLPAGFGAPTGAGAAYKEVGLKKADDELTLRILPSWMACLQARNDFGLFWSEHWGYLGGVNPKDPSKKNFHRFVCTEERQRGGLITHECAECSYIASQKKVIEQAKAELDRKIAEIRKVGAEKKVPEPQIQKAINDACERSAKVTKPIQDWIRVHNRNGKMRIPCIDKSGALVLFRSPYGVVKQLRDEIAKLKREFYPGTQRPIDAAGKKGVFFSITRTGPASPQSDKVTPAMVTDPATGGKFLDFHVVSLEQLEAARKAFPDLEELCNRGRISDAQIEALVALDKLGGGSSDPIEVDAIFAQNSKVVDKTPEPEADPDWMTSAASMPVAETTPVVAETKPAVATEQPTKAPEPAPAATVAAPAASNVLDDPSFEEMFKE